MNGSSSSPPINRATIIGICVFNIVAVGYMGYLVSKIYNRPKPKPAIQLKEPQTAQPDLESLVAEFLEAQQAEEIAITLRRLPATLEPPASERIAELLLDPSNLAQTFPSLRPSQQIDVRDGLSARISSPASLDTAIIQRLETGASDPAVDPILRQQFASTLFDATLRLAPEADLEITEPNRETLLDSTRQLVEQPSPLSGALEPLRIRAWRLLANRHPEVFDQSKLLAEARRILADPQTPEAILMEAIAVIGEGRDKEANPALLALVEADVPRQIKQETLRALAVTGATEEARALVLMSTPDDLQLARALHETAEKILVRVAGNL